uniref:DUF2202 domain-containing protein n=1 Tax=Gracilinema caldarium TaxID=215591 RepID=A0A7C3IH13_9SPIR
MNKMVPVTIAILMVSLGGLVFALDSGNNQTLYGNSAAKADTTLTLQDMLTYAIQDEYLARAEYQGIIAQFGTIRPFSNIIEAEGSHVSWLEQAFKNYKLPIPKDEAKAYIHVPATLKEAYEAGVQAEINNIAMYDRFLASPLVQDPKYTDLKTLFTNLRNASKNHLEAFKNQLNRF